VNELRSSNTHGGYDSDLCSYASKGQWRGHALATCPSDLLTLYVEDFAAPRDAAQAEVLRAEAARLRAEHIDPDALEIWDRYALAARFYRALGEDDAFLGELYHRASWTVRDEVVGVYLGLEGPAAAAELLAVGAQELQKEIPAEDRKKLLHNLARVAHRAGEGALRDRYLDQLLALPSLAGEERRKVERMAQLAREVEPRFQDLAIERYLAWLRLPDRPRDAGIRITYLCADLLRRRGRLREAAPLYSLVALAEDAPQELREMALYLADSIVDEARDGR
jgi:hypothetical protein